MTSIVSKLTFNLFFYSSYLFMEHFVSFVGHGKIWSLNEIHFEISPHTVYVRLVGSDFPLFFF